MGIEPGENQILMRRKILIQKQKLLLMSLLLQFVEEGEYISVLEMTEVPVTGDPPMLISKAVY